MKYVAKHFQVYDDTWEYYHNKDVIQRQCQQTLKTEEAEELCSIPCNLNNSTISKNNSRNINKSEYQYTKNHSRKSRNN